MIRAYGIGDADGPTNRQDVSPRIRARVHGMVARRHVGARDARHVDVFGPVTIPGVTIAGAFAEGTLGGRTHLVSRTLFTPNKEPFAVAAARELPPLVVSRSILSNVDSNQGCYDAWVASW